MPAYRDEKHGTFYASFYYTDFTGARRKKMKRGFKLKRDAQEWERQFLLQRNADPDMKFGDFVEIYRNDKREGSVFRVSGRDESERPANLFRQSDH